MIPDQVLYLYGGDAPWVSSLWTSQDDRVRGGSSISHLTVVNPERANFYGNLDTKTLGGAGFASQRTLGDLALDLSDYAGLNITLAAGDGKKYTLTLKDTIPEKRPDGREESGLSWEIDFVAKEGDVLVKWEDFKPTYRGREKKDAEPLNLKDIKRIALMMRSFFGAQEGDFSLDIKSIAALKEFPNQGVVGGGAESDDEDEDLGKPAQLPLREEPKKSKSAWLRSLLCGLV